ncbi:MAG: hypothetical protein ACJ74J_20535 [Blastocatellia bacterium]
MKKEKESGVMEPSTEEPKKVVDWLRFWLLSQAQCQQLFLVSDEMNAEEI